jgi:hypothetical protein
MSTLRNGLQSADLDVPVTSPTLNLDFANSQSLDSRITFTRGSIGTRVNRNGLIETVDANQPRFDYDSISGECKGLLIEESRQNLLTYSNDFTNPAWIVSSFPTPVVNQIGLDGTTSASTFTALSTTANYVYQNFTCAASTTYTFSFYVKLGTLPASSYKIAVYNNTASSFIAVDVVPTQTLSSSSWTRVSYSFTTPAGCTSARVYPYRSTNSSQNNGTFYLWGAQVEAGAFPTSYIPTSGSTVTRSADNASMTGTNFSSWYNQTEGTVFCSFKTDGISGNPRTFQLTGNNQNERLDHRIVGNTNGSEYYTGSINFGRIIDSGVTNPSQGKITVSQNSRSRQFCMNGRTVSSATIPNAPAVNALNIGSYNLQATYLNGTIKKLAYYPKALSPAELQYLTQ